MLVSWPGGSWVEAAKLAGVIFGSYIAILWLAAVIWTFRDIRDRTADVVSQVIAVVLVLVFNVPGLFLYLIMRPAETTAEAYERSLEAEGVLAELQKTPPCPKCRERTHADYVVCPYCATQLRKPCPQCGKGIDLDWIACAFCGWKSAPPEVEPAAAAAKVTRRESKGVVRSTIAAPSDAAPSLATASEQPPEVL